MFCVRAWTFRVSVGLVWLVSLVFHYWVEERRCLCSFNARFLITAGPVSLAFQKILLGIVSFVFHYWWDGLFVSAAIVRFVVAFRRICADRG